MAEYARATVAFYMYHLLRLRQDMADREIGSHMLDFIVIIEMNVC